MEPFARLPTMYPTLWSAMVPPPAMIAWTADRACRPAVAIYRPPGLRSHRMTRLLLAATAMLSLSANAADVERVTRGNLAIEGIPDIPPGLVQRLRRYQFARGASFTGWTPDG